MATDSATEARIAALTRQLAEKDARWAARDAVVGMTPARRRELLGMCPLGQAILAKEDAATRTAAAAAEARQPRATDGFLEMTGLGQGALAYRKGTKS